MKPCKLWEGATNNKGYGHGWWEGKYWTAHRRAYHEHHGPIPKGRQVQHKCGIKLCVEPSHLKVGTQSENEADKKLHGTDRRYFQYGRRVGSRFAPLEER